MDVALIFPPFVDPRAPYLGLPALSAHLKRAGFETKVFDANVELFDEVFSARHLGLLTETSGDLHEMLIERIDQAKTALRSSTEFFKIEKYCEARNVLELAAMYLSRYYGPSSFSVLNPQIASLTVEEAFRHLKNTSKFDDLLSGYVERHVLSEKPKIVGISVTNSSQLYHGLCLGRWLKKAGVLTVIGGATITLLRREIAQNPAFLEFANCFVFFEGEQPLLTIAENVRSGRPAFRNVGNCVCDVDGNPSSPAHSAANVLDDLATPDFSDLPLARYITPAIVLPLISSKGCSWGKCTFCSIPVTSGSTGVHRERSVDRVVQDIATLRSLHDVKHFFFVDENMSGSRIDTIAQTLAQSSLPEVRWMAFSRFEQGHTLETLSRGYYSGLRKLLMGLESSTPRILKAMRKGTSVGIVTKNINDLAEVKLPINIFCMTGYPGETEEEALETLAFVSDRFPKLLRTGFSCSFSAFHVDEDAPIARDPLIEIDSHKQEVSFARARKLNQSLVERILPFHMIGWEEYSLLYIDNGSSQKRDRDSAERINEVVTDFLSDCLPLRSAPYLFAENFGLLINKDTGAALKASALIPRLLDAGRDCPVFFSSVRSMFQGLSVDQDTLIHFVAVLVKAAFLVAAPNHRTNSDCNAIHLEREV